jgi:uracil-DNA glycosylase family 4
MLAVISGMDGVGKSTIAQNVCEKLNGEITHFSNPKDMKDGKTQYFNFLDNIENLSKLYVCDRFHDGEWVYAPIYRNYIANYMDEIENKIIQDNNYLFLYIKAEFDTILERIRVRGEDFVKPEHFKTVIKNFETNFLLEQKLPFITINTTYGTIESNTKKAVDDILTLNAMWNNIKNCNKNCNVTKPIALPRGNMHGKYMIVGQNPGGKGKGKEDFVTMWSNGSTSKFFIDILKNAGIYLDCWFTNVVLCSTKDNKISSNEVNNCSIHLKVQNAVVNPDKIFTLGKEASKYVKQILPDVEIIEVPHPSYIKRFFSKDENKIKEYTNMFKADE